MISVSTKQNDRKAERFCSGKPAAINRIFKLPVSLGLAIGLSAVVEIPNLSSAGTIITSNLPASTAIININGTQDGAATYNGADQAFWYEPFSSGGVGQLLIYTVQPGTYGFRVIDPADAAQMFPSLTAGQLSEIFPAWTYNSPWVTDYLVFDSSAATNASEPQLFDGAFSNTNGVTWTTYSNATNAYNAAIMEGFYNLIRPGPAGRAGINYTTSYTFRAAESLIFVVPDYDLGDNSGGVSVLISPTTPPVPPSLSISLLQTNTVKLQWTTNAPGFFLESVTNLLSQTWNGVANVPTIEGTNFYVTAAVAASRQFFRLHHY
jgi:hypothetical protein